MKHKNFQVKRLMISLIMTFVMLTILLPVEAEAATVKLSVSKKKMYVSKTFTLTLKNAKGEITWKSSKPSVAIVKDGVITALKAGKTTITAKYKKKTYKCKVTVKSLNAKYDKDYKADIKLNPGLYDKDGKLVRSWDDMLYNGDIEFEDNILKTFCDVREGVKLRIDDSVIRIASGAFSESELESIIIPESVSQIGSSAFEWCEHLVKITIPASVTSIEQYTFSNCTALKSISIPSSVKALGQAAFSNCKSLTSISLPKGVKEINDWTFMNCPKLKKVTLSSKTTYIGMGAFKNCAVLSKITIPSTVTSIGLAAFDGCPKLSESLIKQIKKINPGALTM
ncbi:MAG: leucine-rich repeat protein [Lachnospiraceae bacterium]|nr:leucine-rich repeat protein [Lachnospiraceae bacterium]